MLYMTLTKMKLSVLLEVIDMDKYHYGLAGLGAGILIGVVTCSIIGYYMTKADECD